MDKQYFTARVLAATVLTALLSGGGAVWFGNHAAARWIWAIGVVPVAIGLLNSMIRDIRAGRVGVDAIALLSMIAGLVLGEPLASAVVALMYAGGNTLEEFAVGRAERELTSLVDRAPRFAHRHTANGIEDVPVERIAAGNVLLVRAGEVVPVDGQVSAPNGCLLDEAALTGEPIPVHRKTGEPVRSGTVNAGEAFQMQASATAGASTYAGIVRMVTAAQTARAPFIRMADRYALLLLPVTLLVGVGAWQFSGDPMRFLAVLVAATPCPLILAAPVAFISGVSQAARNGILIKGGGPLEALACARTVMFDKTGTLTVGGARLISVEAPAGGDAAGVLRWAASLEQASHHVVAAAIVKSAIERGLRLESPRDVREDPGAGLEGRIGDRLVRIGSYAYVHGHGKPADWALRVLRRASWRSALSVFVAVDGRAIGALLLGDELRRETPRAIEGLRAAGVSRIVMVTGDRADAAETVAAALDLDAVLADRDPAGKVEAVATEQRQRPTLMVGDGINDAPALAAAGVGIAMGARGASASSEAADVVILVDRIDRVALALVIARRARHIALQSIVAGIGLSGIAMCFAAAGLLPPVAGALTQEAIDVAVILNALRALYPPRLIAGHPALSEAAIKVLHQEHRDVDAGLDRLRQIADALDDAEPAAAAVLIREADGIVRSIVDHERSDESTLYPRLAAGRAADWGLGAMSRAHREIMHLARLLGRLSAELPGQDADRYLVRDAQRLIESVEALVRLHNAQEDDIYEQAASGVK